MFQPGRKAIVTFAAMAALMLAIPRGAAAQATTQPAAATTDSRMRPGPAYIIKRYKTAVAKIDLTDDEKPKVDAVFDQVNQQGVDLSQSLGDLDFQDRYQKLNAFSKQIRQELAGVLTDDQMQELDSKLGSALGGRNGRFGGQGLGGSNANNPTGQNPGNAGANNQSQNNSGQSAQGLAPRPGGGGAGAIELVQQALDKLDLSDDQRQQIKDLMAATRSKIEDIRQNAANGTDVQQQIQQVRREMREKIQTILTPDQYQSFTDSMRQAFQQRGANGNAGGARPAPDAPISSKPVVENKPEDLQSTGPDAGSPAPSIEIPETNGRQFDPSKYKGRVIVLEFGSMSCPVFRTHVQDMEKLKASEGPKAYFLIVYTREAFPAGDKNVERNRNEGINIADAVSLDDRKAQALETQSELRITTAMAVDSMDDAVSTAFGGFPNGAVVIGKDGKIAARQQWTNPDTLRAAIDDAYDAPDITTH